MRSAVSVDVHMDPSPQADARLMARRREATAAEPLCLLMRANERVRR